MTVRGAALVDAVIDRVRRGEGKFGIVWPDPVPPDVLDGLTLPGGLPLPPSLRRWLAFDGAWLERVSAGWGGPSHPVFRAVTIAQAVRELIAENLWRPFQRIERYGRTPVLPLDGEHSLRLLLLADPDEHGEYPVLEASARDGAEVGLVGLGFDTWLARMAGLTESALGDEAESAAVASRVGDGDDRLRILPKPRTHRTDDTDDEPVPSPLPTHTWVQRPFRLPDDVSARWMAAALSQAVSGRDRARVRFLLDEAGRRFPAEQGWKDAALAMAVPAQEWLLDDLLSAGADPNASLGGVTVLARAARHEEADQLRRLLDAGGDPRARDESGDTVLHRAADALEPANVALLLARGADVTAGDAAGRSALWTALASPGWAEWRERVVDTMRLLLGAGADPNADSAHAPTSVLHRAVEFDLGAAVTLLVDHGADVGYRDGRDLTAIELAERYGRWEAFEALRAAAGRAAPDGSAASGSADDPRVPRLLDIRLGDGRGEHELSVRLEVVFPVGSAAQPYRVDTALRSLERFARATVLGLDRFPPGTSSAEWDGPEFDVPDEQLRHDAPIGPYVVEGTYRVRDLAPEAVGLWLRSLVESSARFDAITVHSSQTDATAPGAGWDRWFINPPWDDIRPWQHLPFPVTEAAADGRICVVTADPAEHDSIEWAVTDGVNAVVSELLQMPQAPWVEFGGSNDGHLLFTANDFDGLVRSPSADTAAVMRTVALSVLAGAANEESGTITGVEWNFAVDGDPSAHRTEDFTDPAEDDEEESLDGSE